MTRYVYHGMHAFTIPKWNMRVNVTLDDGRYGAHKHPKHPEQSLSTLVYSTSNLGDTAQEATIDWKSKLPFSLFYVSHLSSR